MKENKKIKIALIAFSLLVLSVCTIFLIRNISMWFDENRLVFSKPVEVSVQTKPLLKVEKREPEKVYIGQEEINKMIKENEKPELAKYICEKFGATQCATALAVAKAESGMREDAYNINTNKTIDVGVYQINSIHFSKAGCSLKEITDAYKNVDCAYLIYKQQGWNPWVAYWSGSYLSKL